MTTTISKTFHFDCAHHLPNVPAGHPCGRHHGHSYRCEVILSGNLDPLMGWFLDYGDITTAWAPIHHAIDHRKLNDVEGLENPTTEVLVDWIIARLRTSIVGPWLDRVRVYESATTWCEASALSNRFDPAMKTRDGLL